MHDDQVFQLALTNARVVEFAQQTARAEGFSEAQARVFAAGCRLCFKLGWRQGRQNSERRKGRTQKPIGRPSLASNPWLTDDRSLTDDRLFSDWLPEIMVERVRELKQTHPELKTDTKRISFILQRMQYPLTLNQAKSMHDRQLARERRIARGQPTKADLQYVARKSLISDAYKRVKCFNSGGSS
jgi:hypothetical protein